MVNRTTRAFARPTKSV